MAARSSLAGASSDSLPRPLIVALVAVAAVGAIALVVLIVRELSPHHATLKGSTAKTADESSIPAPVVPTAAPVLPPKVTRASAAAPAATQATAAPGHSDGLTRVRALASIVHDPDSWPSDGVFHDRIKGIDKYSYENFGPYRRGDLKREAKNPDAWELDGSNGPGRPTNVEDLAPRGGTREAATIRDDKGNTIGTWYAIEAGPLAPAYATVMASGGTRVISRAYLESNRDSFPQPLTSLLDH